MLNYESNPNQRIINIPKDGKEICDTEHVYLKVQKEAMFDAMENLTPTNFEVWLYLASQSNNYTFAFSPQAVSKETGIKKSALQEGIRVLIKEGYLIQRNDSNVYDFYEKPKKSFEEITIVTHKDEPEFIF